MDQQPEPRGPANSPFAQMLGTRVVSSSPEEVVAELFVREELGNTNGVLHGGAVMALADNTGGILTHLHLPPGKATTTVESKTNFLRPIRIGDTARAVSAPLNAGRTLIVVQTTIRRGDGKVAAIVTQTQLVLDWKEKG